MDEKIHTLELTDEELHFLTAFFGNGLKYNDVINGIKAKDSGEDTYRVFLNKLENTLSYSEYVKYKKM